MSQELPYQRLLEEFGSAFNVEGLTEIQITWEGKGKILEGVVDRASWWLGLGNRSKEPQNYQQAIMGVREVIAANTNDSQFIGLSTSWTLHVSRSFFDKVCSLVEESERRKILDKIGPPKKISGQRRLLPAPAPSTQPSSSVTANSPQSAPFFLPETSVLQSELPSLPNALNPAPVNSSGATSSRKRKISEDSAEAKRGGKDKGKGRAIPSTYCEAGAGLTTLPEPLTVDPIEQNSLRGRPSPVGIGRAGPSNWNPSLKESGRGSAASGSTTPASNQQNSKASSQKTVNSISKIHTQFLLRIKKANLAALTPSQRVQLNLCISQANHLEGVPSIPLIGNAPKLHRNTRSSAHSSATNLVRDCQNALSLAAPLLPSSIAATPVDSSGDPSGAVENPPLKRAKTHKSLHESSEERRQRDQKRRFQEMPTLRKHKSGPNTRIGASTNTEGTYTDAAGLEAVDRLGTAIGDISSSEPMPTKASPQMLSPSVPQFSSMASISPPHGSESRRRSPSRSIQQSGAIQQATYHRPAGILIPMSAATSSPAPIARHPSNYIAQTLQAPLDLSLFTRCYQPKQLYPGDSANSIYNTIHLNPTPAATHNFLIGNQDKGISGNDNLLNGYDEQAYFCQYLNIPIEEYIGGQELHAPQLFSESGGQMGLCMEQLQSTTGPIYGQQLVAYSQGHFPQISQQVGIHMSYMSLTGRQLIPPYEFQQQMQWAQDNIQACLPGSEGDSCQNPVALD
ncbi:hypothetical protein EV426DRAFT_710921 [Tirmania nivea]|nr:hypothetical protein EV426DRAFT_710921 [Tirmania nivea]